MPSQDRIPLLIDTDPGVDDALAILMALAEPSVDVVGLTVTAGNVGLAHTVGNALKLLEVAGRDIPVYAGCAAPLLHPAEDAAYVHGRDGFGDTGYAAATTTACDEHAALALLRLSHAHAGRLTLVALGPLTNVALALSIDPTLPQRIARFVVMGGAVTGRGNFPGRLCAEFNIGFDPEAAHVVLSRWPHFEIADWELVVRHAMAHEDLEAWFADGDACGQFYASISRRTRDWSRGQRGERFISADAVAMLHALEPSASSRVERRHLAVELEGVATRGATVVDWDERSGNPANADIVMAVDQAQFEARVRAALGVVR